MARGFPWAVDVFIKPFYSMDRNVRNELPETGRGYEKGFGKTVWAVLFLALCVGGFGIAAAG
jgi:hypothetical protein